MLLGHAIINPFMYTSLFSRKMMALPFLPAHQTLAAFDELIDNVKPGCDTRLKDLIDYFSRNWMNSTIWPPQNWSVYKNTVRTNNDVEGGWNNLEICLLKYTASSCLHSVQFLSFHILGCAIIIIVIIKCLWWRSRLTFDGRIVGAETGQKCQKSNHHWDVLSLEGTRT